MTTLPWGTKSAKITKYVYMTYQVFIFTISTGKSTGTEYYFNVRVFAKFPEIYFKSSLLLTIYILDVLA